MARDPRGEKKKMSKSPFENGLLTIQGERKMEKEEKDKKFHRIERSYGTSWLQLPCARGCRRIRGQG